MEPPQLPEDKPVDTSLQLKSEQEQYAEDQLKNPSKVVLLQVLTQIVYRMSD